MLWCCGDVMFIENRLCSISDNERLFGISGNNLHTQTLRGKEEMEG